MRVRSLKTVKREIGDCLHFFLDSSHTNTGDLIFVAKTPTATALDHI